MDGFYGSPASVRIYTSWQSLRPPDYTKYQILNTNDQILKCNEIFIIKIQDTSNHKESEQQLRNNT